MFMWFQVATYLLSSLWGADNALSESNRDCVEYWIRLIGETCIYIYRGEEISWLIEIEPTEISYLFNQIQGLAGYTRLGPTIYTRIAHIHSNTPPQSQCRWVRHWDWTETPWRQKLAALWWKCRRTKTSSGHEGRGQLQGPLFLERSEDQSQCAWYADTERGWKICTQC
jgi:hypothetical protein